LRGRRQSTSERALALLLFVPTKNLSNVIQDSWVLLACGSHGAIVVVCGEFVLSLLSLLIKRPKAEEKRRRREG